MTGFKLESSGVRSDHCATTTTTDHCVFCVAVLLFIIEIVCKDLSSCTCTCTLPKKEVHRGTNSIIFYKLWLCCVSEQTWYLVYFNIQYKTRFSLCQPGVNVINNFFCFFANKIFIFQRTRYRLFYIVVPDNPKLMTRVK